MNYIFNRLQGDRVIWAIVVLLSLISIVAIYSSTSALARVKQDGNTEFYVLKHGTLIMLGFAAMFIVHRIDYRFFAKMSILLLGSSIVLLIFAMLQGEEAEINDTYRWISVFGFSFQPSDLAKLSIIVYLAKILTRMKDRLNDFKKVTLPIVGITAGVCALIAPSNLSTALLIFICAIVLMFIAGIEAKNLGKIVLVAGLFLVVVISLSNRRVTWYNRVHNFVSSIFDPNFKPHPQTVQSNIAIATGGITGNGPGKSVQRNVLPHPYSDFVFAILVEEYGLVGGFCIVMLYLTIMFRTIAIVRNSRTFGALLAAGLSILIVGQALINMSVTVGLLPITGLPLPLISMGGTSILFTSIAIGIILSISRGIPKLENSTEPLPYQEQPA